MFEVQLLFLFGEDHELINHTRHFPSSSNHNPVAICRQTKSMALSKPSAYRVWHQAKEMPFACDGVPATALLVNRVRKAARSATWASFRASTFCLIESSFFSSDCILRVTLITVLIHKIEGLPTLLLTLEYRPFVPLLKPSRNVF
jgi:hypothetical protein